MTKKLLPVSVLSAALVAAGTIAPVQAGHSMMPAHGQMPHTMIHQGATSYRQQQDNPAKLGVAIAGVSQADLDRLSLEYGVRVEKVAQESVAEAAGLQPGDLVTALNDDSTQLPDF